MDTLLQTIMAGIALYEALCGSLEQEREVLVRHDLVRLKAVNGEREALLVRLAAWEKNLMTRIKETEGKVSLSMLVEQQVAPEERREAAKCMGRFRMLIGKAQELAHINHVLVDRNLSMVRHTLDFITGNSSATVYDPRGGIRQHTSTGLLARKE